MSTPLPNKNVRGSTSGVPIMALFDLLGQRWNLRIMWELRGGALTFRALQKKCGGVSPSVLNGRLKQLTEAKLLHTGANGYALSELGDDLMEELDGLRSWSSVWSDAVGE